MKLEEKFYKKDSVKIRYFEGGEGKTLLFFHGSLANISMFKEVLEKLADNLHIVAIDLPGHGKSNFPNRIKNYEDYIDVLKVFTVDIIESDFSVFGYSLGALMALEIAKSSTKVNKIVLVDAWVIKGKESLFSLLINLFNRIFIKNIFVYKNIKAIFFLFKSNLENLIWRNFSFLKTDKLYLEIFKKLSNTNDLIDLAKIKQRTLILWGNEDIQIPLKYGEKINKKIKNSELVIVEKTNHDWPLERVDFLVEKVKDFLNS